LRFHFVCEIIIDSSKKIDLLHIVNEWLKKIRILIGSFKKALTITHIDFFKSLMVEFELIISRNCRTIITRHSTYFFLKKMKNQIILRLKIVFGEVEEKTFSVSHTSEMIWEILNRRFGFDMKSKRFERIKKNLARNC
jgi:hypothetical protein